MNFVFHRHLAERDLGSVQAALGAMLPDLWRMAERRLRPKKEALGADLLSMGIRHHLELDSWFHDQPIFLEGQAMTGAAFAKIEAPRIRLFAHVSWEMCLDGALIRQLGVEPAIEQVRHSLRSVDMKDHRDAIARHFPNSPKPGLEEAGSASEVAVALESLERLFRSLDAGDWIAGYAEGHGLTARLDGVRRRFGFERLQEPARSQVAEAFEKLLSEAAPRLGELLEGSQDVAKTRVASTRVATTRVASTRVATTREPS